MELARQLVAAGVVDSISASTIRRILQSHQPSQQPGYRLKCQEIAPLPNRFKKLATCTLETEATRNRNVSMKNVFATPSTQSAHSPAQPRLPVRVEHEYQRKGALNLFAALTRAQAKSGDRHERKRQESLLGFRVPGPRNSRHIIKVHVVLDNPKMHKGKGTSMVSRPSICFHPLSTVLG